MRMRARRTPMLKSRGGFLFGIAFMGLFSLIGSFLLLGAWVTFQDDDLDNGVVFLSFGAMFFIAGTSALIGSIRDRGIHKRDQARKEEHPGEPWVWYDEWKDGRIHGHGLQKVIVVWCVAFFWSAIVGSMFYAGLGEFRSGSPVLMGTVPFLAIAVGIYVWAVRLTLRWRRFGASILELETFPGVIGGSLRALLILPSGVQPSTDLRARLGCHRIDHTEEHGSESTLWSTEVTLPANQMMMLAGGAGRQLEFAIPGGLEPSTPLPEMEEVVWDLDVWGEGVTVPYRTSFQVPVFVTPESRDETEPSPEPSHAPVHGSSGARFDSISRIDVSPSISGGYEFVFPYPRQAGSIATITLALIMATAACLWFLAGSVPLWIPLTFGVLDLMFVFMALVFFARCKQVQVRTDGVRIRGGGFSIGSSHFVPREEIEKIESRVTFESGAFALHDLILTQTTGKRLSVGLFIRSKPEADWLAGRMRDALDGR